MKIYRVVAYDSAHSFYHFGTKREAEAEAKKQRTDYADSEWADSATVEIETVEIKPTRASIAAALQDLVDFTCMNEH